MAKPNLTYKRIEDSLEVKGIITEVQSIESILLELPKEFKIEQLFYVGDWVIDENDHISIIDEIEQGPFYVCTPIDPILSDLNLDPRQKRRLYQRKHITKVPKGDPNTIRILYGKTKAKQEKEAEILGRRQSGL